MTWTCPSCERRFARNNQRHVCSRWTVDDHLRGQAPAGIQLFHLFTDIVASCGPFEYSVTKTTVGFRGSRRVFAGARPTEKGLKGYLDLTREIDDPRVNHVAPYTKRLFVNHFLIRDERELDDEFVGWVAESYGVGAGAHLMR